MYILSGTQCAGFQFLMILDLWDINFHIMVVFGLGNELLSKSVQQYEKKFTKLVSFSFYW
jgi:hypothetical protein